VVLLQLSVGPFFARRLTPEAKKNAFCTETIDCIGRLTLQANRRVPKSAGVQ